MRRDVGFLAMPHEIIVSPMRHASLEHPEELKAEWTRRAGKEAKTTEVE